MTENKPNGETRTCASCTLKMKRPRRNIKRNSLCDCGGLNEESELIHDDYSKKPPQKFGQGNHALNVDIENLLCENILKLSNKNFIFDREGLQMFVKIYLDRLGVRVDRFKDNCPGIYWATAFFRRHRQRLDVSKAKATRNSETDKIHVSRAIITGFQEELMALLEVHPSTKSQASDCGMTCTPTQYSAHSSPVQKTVFKKKRPRKVTSVNSITKYIYKYRCATSVVTAFIKFQTCSTIKWS